jgi:hypothetical protein
MYFIHSKKFVSSKFAVIEFDYVVLKFLNEATIKDNTVKLGYNELLGADKICSL